MVGIAGRLELHSNLWPLLLPRGSLNLEPQAINQQTAQQRMKSFAGQLILLSASVLPGEAFQLGAVEHGGIPLRLALSEEQWTGEVVSDDDGRIRGCTITPVKDKETEFIIQIDGNEADLGNFGKVVYQKITSDAKRESFKGYRPGTIPPHLLGTYRSFAMDEVAREATLEAMQQNNIRPFDSARQELLIEQVSIPPKLKKKKKGKGGRKKQKQKAIDIEQEEEEDAPVPWETFDTMQEALKAGWEPGQSFSFVATNCRGQQIEPVQTERPPVI